MAEFSVFLPVRNGWPYVQECVESILTQTHEDLELVVLDNNSTDETLAWLTTLRDPRVRIETSDTSLTITESWARVLNQPKREFLTLIGHDDLLDPGFLASINALIGAHPGASIYQSGSRFINSEGRVIRSCRPIPAIETAADYLRARFSFTRDVFGTGSVMRSRDYDAVGGIFDFEKLLFADDALWLSLMQGSFKATEPAELFSVRIHPASESASLPSNWQSLLRGLQQFHEFLGGFAARDEAAAEVLAASGGGFFLTYLRNIYILAMVEASVAGKQVSATTRKIIEDAREQFSGRATWALSRSPKVKAVEVLSASPARSAIPPLWRLYTRLKSGA